MVIYQFSNTLQVFFVVLFSLVVLVSIIVGIMSMPLLKLIVKPDNTKKAKTILSLICVPIYLLCVCGVVFGTINIVEYSATAKNRCIENCNTIYGEITEIVETPQFSRGADLVSYHVTFTIDGHTFCIDDGIGVPAENMEHWGTGEYITVYYYTEKNRDVVVCVVK